MYNWKSCKLNGVEIISLRLNGNLVWEKQLGSIFYSTLSDDFDTALTQFQQLEIDSMINLGYSQEVEFNSPGAGRPIILTTGNVNSVTVSYYVDAPVFKWFPVTLSKGVVSITDESEYDLPPKININGTLYTVWTPDGDDFNYTVPIRSKCKITIS